MREARRARFSQSRSNRHHATPTDRCRSAVGIVPSQHPRIISVKLHSRALSATDPYLHSRAQDIFHVSYEVQSTFRHILVAVKALILHVESTRAISRVYTSNIYLQEVPTNHLALFSYSLFMLPSTPPIHPRDGRRFLQAPFLIKNLVTLYLRQYLQYFNLSQNNISDLSSITYDSVYSVDNDGMTLKVICTVEDKIGTKG